MDGKVCGSLVIHVEQRKARSLFLSFLDLSLITDGIFIDESEEELEYTTDEMNIEEQFVNTIDLAEQEYNVAAAVEDVIIYDDMEDDVVPMDESDEDYPIRSERIIEEPEQVEEEDGGRMVSRYHVLMSIIHSILLTHPLLV